MSKFGIRTLFDELIGQGLIDPNSAPAKATEASLNTGLDPRGLAGTLEHLSCCLVLTKVTGRICSDDVDAYCDRALSAAEDLDAEPA